MKIVILAGGSGTRLWPVSREKDPKQTQTILGKKTLLQQTYTRLRKGFAEKDIFLSINKNQLAEVCRQLPRLKKSQLICEPAKRDTAAAIGLACAYIFQKFPNEIIATVNSDHHIKNEREFIRVLKQAGRTVKIYPGHLVLIGIKPTYPETGYGYIKLNKQLKSFNGDKSRANRLARDKVFSVDCFKEKPDLATAKKYLKSWEYLWNPAYFVFYPATMLELFKKFLPDQFVVLNKIKNSRWQDLSPYTKIKPISIDYGIMEKTDKLLCLPASFGWSDIGHWRTVQEILSAKKTSGDNHIQLDGHGNMVYSLSHKLVATIGLKNTIIIETDDAILICRKDKAQDVKKVVKLLKEKGLTQYL